MDDGIRSGRSPFLQLSSAPLAPDEELSPHYLEHRASPSAPSSRSRERHRGAAVPEWLRGAHGESKRLHVQAPKFVSPPKKASPPKNHHWRHLQSGDEEDSDTSEDAGDELIMDTGTGETMSAENCAFGASLVISAGECLDAAKQEQCAEELFRSAVLNKLDPFEACDLLGQCLMKAGHSDYEVRVILGKVRGHIERLAFNDFIKDRTYIQENLLLYQKMKDVILNGQHVAENYLYKCHTGFYTALCHNIEGACGDNMPRKLKAVQDHVYDSISMSIQKLNEFQEVVKASHRLIVSLKAEGVLDENIDSEAACRAECNSVHNRHVNEAKRLQESYKRVSTCWSAAAHDVKRLSNLTAKRKTLRENRRYTTQQVERDIVEIREKVRAREARGNEVHARRAAQRMALEGDLDELVKQEQRLARAAAIAASSADGMQRQVEEAFLRELMQELFDQAKEDAEHAHGRRESAQRRLEDAAKLLEATEKQLEQLRLKAAGTHLRHELRLRQQELELVLQVATTAEEEKLSMTESVSKVVRWLEAHRQGPWLALGTPPGLSTMPMVVMRTYREAATRHARCLEFEQRQLAERPLETACCPEGAQPPPEETVWDHHRLASLMPREARWFRCLVRSASLPASRAPPVAEVRPPPDAARMLCCRPGGGGGGALAAPEPDETVPRPDWGRRQALWEDLWVETHTLLSSPAGRGAANALHAYLRKVMPNALPRMRIVLADGARCIRCLMRFQMSCSYLASFVPLLHALEDEQTEFNIKSEFQHVRSLLLECITIADQRYCSVATVVAQLSAVDRRARELSTPVSELAEEVEDCSFQARLLEAVGATEARGSSVTSLMERQQALRLRAARLQQEVRHLCLEVQAMFEPCGPVTAMESAPLCAPMLLEEPERIVEFVRLQLQSRLGGMKESIADSPVGADLLQQLAVAMSIWSPPEPARDGGLAECICAPMAVETAAALTKTLASEDVVLAYPDQSASPSSRSKSKGLAISRSRSGMSASDQGSPEPRQRGSSKQLSPGHAHGAEARSPSRSSGGHGREASASPAGSSRASPGRSGHGSKKEEHLPLLVGSSVRSVASASPTAPGSPFRRSPTASGRPSSRNSSEDYSGGESEEGDGESSGEDYETPAPAPGMHISVKTPAEGERKHRLQRGASHAAHGERHQRHQQLGAQVVRPNRRARTEGANLKSHKEEAKNPMALSRAVLDAMPGKHVLSAMLSPARQRYLEETVERMQDDSRSQPKLSKMRSSADFVAIFLEGRNCVSRQGSRANSRQGSPEYRQGSPEYSVTPPPGHQSPEAFEPPPEVRIQAPETEAPGAQASKVPSRASSRVPSRVPSKDPAQAEHLERAKPLEVLACVIKARNVFRAALSRRPSTAEEPGPARRVPARSPSPVSDEAGRGGTRGGEEEGNDKHLDSIVFLDEGLAASSGSLRTTPHLAVPPEADGHGGKWRQMPSLNSFVTAGTSDHDSTPSEEGEEEARDAAGPQPQVRKTVVVKEGHELMGPAGGYRGFVKIKTPSFSPRQESPSRAPRSGGRDVHSAAPASRSDWVPLPYLKRPSSGPIVYGVDPQQNQKRRSTVLHTVTVDASQTAKHKVSPTLLEPLFRPWEAEDDISHMKIGSSEGAGPDPRRQLCIGRKSLELKGRALEGFSPTQTSPRTSPRILKRQMTAPLLGGPSRQMTAPLSGIDSSIEETADTLEADLEVVGHQHQQQQQLRRTSSPIARPARRSENDLAAMCDVPLHLPVRSIGDASRSSTADGDLPSPKRARSFASPTQADTPSLFMPAATNDSGSQVWSPRSGDSWHVSPDEVIYGCTDELPRSGSRRTRPTPTPQTTRSFADAMSPVASSRPTPAPEQANSPVDLLDSLCQRQPQARSSLPVALPGPDFVDVPLEELLRRPCTPSWIQGIADRVARVATPQVVPGGLSTATPTGTLDSGLLSNTPTPPPLGAPTQEHCKASFLGSSKSPMPSVTPVQQSAPAPASRQDYRHRWLPAGGLDAVAECWVSLPSSLVPNRARSVAGDRQPSPERATSSASKTPAPQPPRPRTVQAGELPQAGGPTVPAQRPGNVFGAMRGHTPLASCTRPPANVDSGTRSASVKLGAAPLPPCRSAASAASGPWRTESQASAAPAAAMRAASPASARGATPAQARSVTPTTARSATKTAGQSCVSGGGGKAVAAMCGEGGPASARESRPPRPSRAATATPSAAQPQPVMLGGFVSQLQSGVSASMKPMQSVPRTARSRPVAPARA